MKIISKAIGGKMVFLALFLFVLFFASTAFAQLNNWSNNLNTGAGETKIYKTDVAEGGTAATIAKYVGAILYIAPFLGFMFIVRIVMAGYEWMTAAGNTEKIELSKKRMINATIGVVIFAVLYFLTYFFVTKFAGVTGYTI